MSSHRDSSSDRVGIRISVAKMEFRKIAGTKLEVSRIGLGTWAMGGWMWGGINDAEATKFKCFAKFFASFWSTELWLLPCLVVCFLIVSVSGCARLIPVRENYFETGSAMSVPENHDEPVSTISVPENYAPDLSIPSSFRDTASYPFQGGSAVSRTTQGGFLPLVPGGSLVRLGSTGSIQSTSPMLTPAQGSMAMPGGGFYPMR
jgi:hypothetical protein